MSEFDPRLLLVEDDRMRGVSSFSALRDEGYAIVWARTGAAALLQLDEPGNPFSLLVLDWNLPARDALADREAALRAGASDELAKPIPVADLKAPLRHLAGEAQRA